MRVLTGLCVLNQVNINDVGATVRSHLSLVYHFREKAFDCMDNNYQGPLVTHLLSLFTQLQLWEMTNQYLIPGQIFALCERKILLRPFHPHTVYTLSHCVY